MQPGAHRLVDLLPRGVDGDGIGPERRRRVTGHIGEVMVHVSLVRKPGVVGDFSECLAGGLPQHCQCVLQAGDSTDCFCRRTDMAIEEAGEVFA